MQTATNNGSGHRAALVTGGARRVGRAIVEDLAAHGWAVAIHYGTSEAEAAALADDIRRAGGNAAIVGGDLADVAGVSGIVAAASAALGPLSLLVNNAAIYEKDAPGSLDLRLFERQLAINLSSPVFLAEAFAAQVPEGEDANIVNLLDPRVFRPEPDYFSYQISKSALHAATIALARAYAPRIRVNAIAPGPVVPSAQHHAGAIRPSNQSVTARPRPQSRRFRPHRAVLRREHFRDRRGDRAG